MLGLLLYLGLELVAVASLPQRMLRLRQYLLTLLELAAVSSLPQRMLGLR